MRLPSPLPPRWRARRPHLVELLRALVSSALLVGIYYLVPVEPEVAPVWRVVRSAVAAVAVGLLAVIIARMVARLMRGHPGSRPANLLVGLFAGLVLFAFIDYQIAISLPGQFARLHTKTDGLYFAVSTFTTVGYGDVHASGQLGRAVVIGQQLFNVVVLTTGGAVLVNQLTAAQPLRRPPGPDPPRPDPDPTGPDAR